ncbi:MAG: hypothetical protein HYY44_09140 [Deltaproteobacteria bacterium]|nr:hypothetical protein [Deltaproteobacteria bacterium]MBI4374106.1 hypothetical protein [Deltaproteobacteria bacterium]
MESIEEKTTILLTKSLKVRLARLSKITGKSVAQLLREAAENQYFSASPVRKKEIVRQMSALNIPVGTPEEVEEEILAGHFRNEP